MNNNEMEQRDQLKKENIYLRKLLDSLSQGICYVDENHKIIFSNKTQLKIFNLEADKVIGKDVNSIYPNTGHIQAQKTKEKFQKDSLTFDRFGVTVRTKYIPLWDDDGKFIGTAGVSKLLDDYKDISIGVKGSGSIYSNFSLMFDSLKEAIVAVDIAGMVVYANKSYNQIVGAEENGSTHSKLKLDSLAKIAMSTMSNAKQIHESSVSINDNRLDVISMPILTDETVLGCLCIINNDSTFSLISEQLEKTTKLVEYYRSRSNIQHKLPLSFETLVGKSSKLNEQLFIAAKAALTDCNIVIRGNNGVGKELVARAIHGASNRANGPFVPVNCAALPDNLLESELFGYESGAFTGASKEGKPGKFELADGGTIFLDEIGDMSYYMQAKLLRILQNKENERVGSTKTQKLDVRVLSATNKNLEEMISRREFREDLYYRLNVVSLKIPELKDRKEDIPLLVDHFLSQYATSKFPAADPNGKIHVADEVLELLAAHDWPGNVRELGNVIEAAIVFAEDGVVQPYHLPSHFWTLEDTDTDGDIRITGKTKALNLLIEETEKIAILRALKETGNNRTKAMDALGLSRRAFYYKLNKYQITV
jgi:transcriptional regulator with PAS, ATPase and Fis domain